MKLTFEEFCNLCADKKVTHQKTGLRADYDRSLEKLLGEFATNTIFVGNDNTKDGFEINSGTFCSIELVGTDVHAVYGSDCVLAGQCDIFTVSEWD